jgi:hypothetical protein
VRVVVLDSGLLGMVTNPTASAINDQASLWLEGILRSGVEVILPEIADYEVRRELLLHDKLGGLRRLDILKESPTITFLPITTSAMLLAARF